MARKPKTSPIEDVIGIIAAMPWWVCISLAVVSYFVLHALAAPDVSKPANVAQLGEMAGRMIWKTAAAIGQFAIPMICLMAAVISTYRQLNRKALVDHVAESKTADALDGMSWLEFERLVGEAFRLDGFAVAERGGAGADGGVDLVLRKGQEKFLVQCKQWRALKVGVDVVRALYGVMAANGATGGFVVTSGTFSNDAQQFASGRNVILIDGIILFDMIKRAQRAPIGTTKIEPATPATAQSRVPSVSQTSCPICSSAMVQRTAKRGGNAGQAFWGCSAYPGCKGTRAIG